MTELIISSTLIIAITLSFLCVKVILKKNGSFASQHIHDSKAMRERGIHCVMDQDREMRRKSPYAVSEHN
ncbi:hypothetical protein L6475_06620 [Prevotella sp. E9-3]|nr:hypothetical protein [Prevotella sp. E9-3]UKK49600.1 hypothetical protein L6475_06620 [Prevotella sp. E9-3]